MSCPVSATDPLKAPKPATGRSTAFWTVLASIAAIFALFPFCCCGGLLWWSSTFTDFKISNGQHLGDSPMNVKFDYELRDTGHGPPKGYTIVVRSADGTTRDRPIGGGFIDRRGTMTFHALEVGPQSTIRGPVKVWIESSDAFGRGASTASNTLTIRTKS